MVRLNLRLPLLLLSLVIHVASGFYAPPLGRPSSCRAAMQTGRESDDVAGAVANTFGDIFGSFFKGNAEKQAEIDRAYAEQLEVAARRRNPEAYRKKLRETEERRARASAEFADSIAWCASRSRSVNL